MVLELAETFGLAVTAAQRADIDRAEFPALRALRTTLLKTRAWPQGE